MDQAQRQAADEMARILKGIKDLNLDLTGSGEDLRLDNWEHFISQYDELCADIPETLRRWQIACGQLEMAL